MKLSIHRITPIDIGPVAAMAKALIEEMGPEYPIITDGDIEQMMFLFLENMRNPEAVHLIAHDGKKPAGFFMGHVAQRPYGTPKRVGVAQEIYVVPDKRGAEVGFALIQAAVRIALEAGADGFEAIGSYGRTDQRWFKLGFTPYVSHSYLTRDMAEQVLMNKRRRKQDESLQASNG